MRARRSGLALLALAGAVGAQDYRQVTATGETEPVKNALDAADDPAIWVDPKDPARSLLVCTDKTQKKDGGTGGLFVYDLSGKLLGGAPGGGPNNVDLRPGFRLGGREIVLVCAGNRDDNSIGMFELTPAGKLVNVAARVVTMGAPVYGCCMYRAPGGRCYFFATSKKGVIEQWELLARGDKVDAELRRTITLPPAGPPPPGALEKDMPVCESCVVDDATGLLYVSQEQVGIWEYDAPPENGTKPGRLIDRVGQGRLVADVEGLAVVPGPGNARYLIVSSQGNYSYVVYKREGRSWTPFSVFKVVDGRLGGAEETDGLDATAAPLGAGYPHGVLVVQDGHNQPKNQNFKLIPLEQVLVAGPTGGAGPAITPPAEVAKAEEEGKGKGKGKGKDEEGKGEGKGKGKDEEKKGKKEEKKKKKKEKEQEDGEEEAATVAAPKGAETAPVESRSGTGFAEVIDAGEVPAATPPAETTAAETTGPTPPTTEPTTGDGERRVKLESTVYELAKKLRGEIPLELRAQGHTITTPMLLLANGYKPGEPVPRGKELTVPASAPRRDHLSLGSEEDGPMNLWVQEGDTIQGIARRYGITVQELFRENPVLARKVEETSAARALRAGDSVRLPAAASARRPANAVIVK